ncbi:MAG: 1-deoxy-D-xylulose-5-phosphate reductoisomerase, partial [Ktedonobacteraceae bacterium]
AREALPNVIFGEQALIDVATHPDVDIVVAATSGLMGLAPTLAAIKAGKTIALANKETLVMAGHLVMRGAQDAGVSILPIDSEHSAIWQCLQGENAGEIHRLILTASGGPFRRTTDDQMRSVTVQQALAHPTWLMGPKITIDSATLMNKGLEVLEARWLFGIPYDRIHVIVHPESIIHSMIEFVDGSLKMQASLPSMHLPIQYALSHPNRLDTSGTGLVRELHWSEVLQLNFETLDITRFPCFRLALDAAKQGDTYPSVLVGADEEAVALFLAGKIGFLEIAKLIEAVLERHTPVPKPEVPAILEATSWARRTAQELYETTLQRNIV